MKYLVIVIILILSSFNTNAQKYMIKPSKMIKVGHIYKHDYSIKDAKNGVTMYYNIIRVKKARINKLIGWKCVVSPNDIRIFWRLN